MRYYLRKPAFILAVSFTVVSLLTAQWAWAETPYQKAVRSADLDAISELATVAKDIDTPGTNSKTALMIAAKAGDAELVKTLLEHGAEVNATNVNGGTPIMFAAISGDVETMQLLIDQDAGVSAQGSNGWSALMVAAAKGHTDACRMLISAGADINTEDIYLWTPLLRAAYENREEVVKLLLEQESINLMHRDDHGATALHHAASIGAVDIVEALLSSGIDPMQADFSGRTPATYAIERGYEDLARILENQG